MADRRLDILVVGVVLQLLQVAVVGYVGQPLLYLGLRGDLQRGRERIEPVPQEPPPAQRVAIVGQFGRIDRRHVDGNDVAAAVLAQHDVPGDVVDVAAVQEEVTVPWVTQRGQDPGVAHAGPAVAPHAACVT